MAQSGVTKVVRCALKDVGKRSYLTDLLGNQQRRAISYTVPLATTTSLSHNHAAKANLWNSGYQKQLFSTETSSKFKKYKLKC